MSSLLQRIENWKSERECAAFTLNTAALHPYPAMMHTDQLRDNTQTQTCTRGRDNHVIITTIKSVEYSLLFFGRDAYPIVTDVYLDLVSESLST